MTMPVTSPTDWDPLDPSDSEFKGLEVGQCISDDLNHAQGEQLSIPSVDQDKKTQEANLAVTAHPKTTPQVQNPHQNKTVKTMTEKKKHFSF